MVYKPIKGQTLVCIRSHSSSPTQGHCFSGFLHHQLHLVFLLYLGYNHQCAKILLTTHLLLAVSPFFCSATTLLKRVVYTCSLQSFPLRTHQNQALNCLYPTWSFINFMLTPVSVQFSVFHLI